MSGSAYAGAIVLGIFCGIIVGYYIIKKQEKKASNNYKDIKEVKDGKGRKGLYGNAGRVEKSDPKVRKHKIVRKLRRIQVPSSTVHGSDSSNSKGDF